MPDPLTTELETFNAKRQELLKDNQGKFAVIYGTELIGVFVSYEDALKAGLAKAGANPFLVKQISETEPIYFFTREVVCPIV